MNRRIYQIAFCLFLVAKDVYQANDFPRLHTVSACFWGLMAGSYLTELYMITEMGFDL